MSRILLYSALIIISLIMFTEGALSLNDPQTKVIRTNAIIIKIRNELFAVQDPLIAQLKDKARTKAKDVLGNSPTFKSMPVDDQKSINLKESEFESKDGNKGKIRFFTMKLDLPGSKDKYGIMRISIQSTKINGSYAALISQVNGKNSVIYKVNQRNNDKTTFGFDFPTPTSNLPQEKKKVDWWCFLSHAGSCGWDLVWYGWGGVVGCAWEIYDAITSCITEVD